MAALVESQLQAAITAFERRDVTAAEKLIPADRRIDEFDRDIELKVMALLAREVLPEHALREVMTMMKLTGELERVGDLAKNIAKRVVAISERGHSVSLVRGIDHLGDLALAQLKEVLDAFGSRTVTRINMVRDRDDEIDAMYTSLFRELLTYMMEDPRNITTCTHLLFCAKNIERIGDHATNIAESVYYIVTGEHLAAYRPKEDKTHKIVVDTTDE